MGSCDACEEPRGGALVLEGDRQHAPAAREPLLPAGDALDRPVAAFDEHLRAAGADQRLRRVVLEPSNRADRLERRDDGHAVGEPVQRPIRAFAQAPGGGVTVEAHQQACPFGASAGEVSDVAAVQDVEDAVGEHQRALELAEPARELARIADLGFVGRGYCPALVRGRQSSSVALQYSNTLTTLRTPPVLRAMSTASSASASLTTPIRYTAPASVTTLRCTGLTRLVSDRRPRTLVVR